MENDDVEVSQEEVVVAPKPVRKSDWEANIKGGAAVRQAANALGLMAAVVNTKTGPRTLVQLPNRTKKEAEQIAKQLGKDHLLREVL